MADSERDTPGAPFFAIPTYVLFKSADIVTLLLALRKIYQLNSFSDYKKVSCWGRRTPDPGFGDFAPNASPGAVPFPVPDPLTC